MKRIQTLMTSIVLVAICAADTRAQDPEALYWTFNPRANRDIEAALAELSIPGMTAFSDDVFFSLYDSQPWSLVIIRRKDVLSFTTQVELMDRLEGHLARGGRVLVHLAEIERMPMLQDFFGLDDAEDIVTPEVARPLREPRHPAGMFPSLELADEPMTDEFGASLIPASGSKPFYAFDDGTIASVLAREGQVIANGWEPDGWDGSGFLIAIDNLRWLLGCPADLNGDGSLDLFDFLEFQTLFDAGDPRADWFCYDGRLDVFDFLAFFNAFDTGCP